MIQEALEADPDMAVDPENEDDWGLTEEEQHGPLAIPHRALPYQVVLSPSKKTLKPAAKDGKVMDKQSPSRPRASGKKLDHPKNKSDSWGAKKVKAKRRIHEVEEYNADDTSNIEVLGSGDDVSAHSTSESINSQLVILDNIQQPMPVQSTTVHPTSNKTNAQRNFDVLITKPLPKQRQATPGSSTVLAMQGQPAPQPSVEDTPVRLTGQAGGGTVSTCSHMFAHAQAQENPRKSKRIDLQAISRPTLTVDDDDSDIEVLPPDDTYPSSTTQSRSAPIPKNAPVPLRSNLLDLQENITLTPIIESNESDVPNTQTSPDLSAFPNLSLHSQSHPSDCHGQAPVVCSQGVPLSQGKHGMHSYLPSYCRYRQQ